MKRIALLFAVLIPAFAFAQETPAPSIWQGLVNQFLTPAGIASIVVTVLGIVAGLLKLSDIRKQQIAGVTYHAFHAIEDLSATTENTVDDKVAAGLKVADEWMRAQGWRPLKPEEKELVRMGFTTLNGTMKAAEKVQAGAFELAGAEPPERPTSPPTP